MTQIAWRIIKILVWAPIIGQPILFVVLALWLTGVIS